jgi:hypothetical protein
MLAPSGRAAGSAATAAVESAPEAVVLIPPVTPVVDAAGDPPSEATIRLPLTSAGRTHEAPPAEPLTPTSAPSGTIAKPVRSGATGGENTVLQPPLLDGPRTGAVLE